MSTHVPGKDKIYLGQFTNWNTEKKFLDDNKTHNYFYYRPFLLILSFFYFVFIIPDYFIINNTSTFKIIFLLRTILMITTLVIYLKSESLLSENFIYLTTTIFEIIAITIFLFSAYFYNPFHFIRQYLSVIIFILCFFFIIPNKLMNKITLSVIFIILFLLISINRIGFNEIDLIAIIAYSSLIIIASSISALQIDNLQRAKYLNNLKLKQLSTTDPLTGACNRLQYTKEIDNLVAIAQRYKAPFSLIMFDIDSFKDINDKYGHLIGDQILKELVQLVLKQIRETDTLARIGGEEFAIILPKTTIDNALNLSIRIKNKIAKHPFSWIEQLTCSFGVAQYFTGSCTDFIQSVDNMLYQAKNNGKNQVASVANKQEINSAFKKISHSLE